MTAKPRILLFTGHRIDTGDRNAPRFPSASEGIAREMIVTAVRIEQAAARGRSVLAMSAGASGGDILFHEACAAEGIPGVLCLALPKAEFAAASVLDAGPDWLARYDALCSMLPIELMPDNGRCDDRLSVWQRANLWMLDTALARSSGDTTLIALWDGDTEDGPGGTRDMVRRAEAGSARIVLLDAGALTR